MSDAPTICANIDQCRELITRARTNARVGLVPTMGALHEGHLSLVRASKQHCDFTAVTIFVNPTQFGANEDLDAYPRPLEQDINTLKELGVDLVFTPDESTMYPPGCSTVVQPPDVASVLEGAHRPTHFSGVTTIVCKLFQILPAHIAFFGRKDYQQTVVIRRMVQDLNIPIEIQVEPTVRESDGLALSSRNQYLNEEQRQRAVALSESLSLAIDRFRAGETDAEQVRNAMMQHLQSNNVKSIDYVALVDPDTLQPLSEVRAGAVALVAAKVGGTRLIDNKQID